MLLAAALLLGVSNFVHADRAKYAVNDVVVAILQTVGAILVASSDIDMDLFVRRNRMRAFAFVLLWVSGRASFLY
jgi:hypothetical protein